MHKQIIYVLGITLCAGVSLCSYADVPPPANLAQQCQEYIIPDNQFSSMFETLSQNNLAQAQSVAALLNQCNYYNVCSQITNVQNCAGLLNTNDYLANYITQDVASNGSNAMGSLAPVSAPAQVTSPTESVTTESAPPAVATPKPSTTPNSEGKSNSEVRWF
jgi:hypothetical protein